MTRFIAHLSYPGLSKKIQEKLKSFTPKGLDDIQRTVHFMLVTNIVREIMQRVRAQAVPQDNPWPDVLKIAAEVRDTFLDPEYKEYKDYLDKFLKQETGV